MVVVVVGVVGGLKGGLDVGFGGNPHWSMLITPSDFLFIVLSPKFIGAPYAAPWPSIWGLL